MDKLWVQLAAYESDLRGASAIKCGSRCPIDGAGPTFDRDDEHRQANRNRHPGENVAEGQPPVGQPCLHRGRSKFGSEFQGSVRSREVVVASQELNVVGESVLPPRVRK